jgi:hypothetical protein
VHTWPNFGFTVAYSGGGGGGGVITPATLSVGAGTVSRISGVAPLAVHFTSEGTTSTNTSKPFHELEYGWNFGDTGAGNWSKGVRSGTSKNSHYGPIAAHVFETPGTYTVTMGVADGTNTAASQVVITVSDPDTVFASDTVCFSTDTDFTGAPAGATQVTTSNHATAINTYKSTKKRLLFKRGQTFTSTTAPVIDVQGPGIIGAFGTGAKPIWRRGSTSYVNLSIGTGSGGAILRDWRIVDIDIDGQNSDDANNVGTRATQTLEQILYLRTDMRGMYTSAEFNRDIITSIGGAPKTMFDQIAIHEGLLTGVPGGYASGGTAWRVAFSGYHLSVQGVEADNLNDGGSHVVRCFLLQNSVIANNNLSRSNAAQHLIKMHAPEWTGFSGWLVNVYSEKNHVSDNNLASEASGWAVAIGPQDEYKDERLRDILIERNYLTSGSGLGVGFNCFASKTTIRNNVVNLSNCGIYPTAINVTTRGIEPAPDDVCVYNNTITGTTGGNALTAIQVSLATNTKVKNNLIYNTGTFPFGKTAFSDSGTGTVASNNSSTAQMNGTSPSFVTTPPVTFSDHKITSGSYAVGYGAAVPVVTDAVLIPISLTSPDIGAFTH